MKPLLPLLALALAACATIPPASAGPTAALGQQAQVGGLRIRPIAIIEDSRCPVDVQCVWAGRLMILAEVEFDGGSESFRGNITLGEALPLGAETVTLVAALPPKTTGAVTDPRAYRFTFASRPSP